MKLAYKNLPIINEMWKQQNCIKFIKSKYDTQPKMLQYMLDMGVLGDRRRIK